jgi:hypothetical protein
MATTQDELAAAAYAPDPITRLTAVVRRLVTQGRDRESIYADLEQLRAILQRDGRDEAEDAVLEVMDFLTGWSSPHMKI